MNLITQDLPPAGAEITVWTTKKPAVTAGWVMGWLKFTWQVLLLQWFLGDKPDCMADHSARVCKVSINETLSRYENPIACSGFFKLKKIMPLQSRQGRVMGISRMLPPVIGGFFFQFQHHPDQNPVSCMLAPGQTCS